MRGERAARLCAPGGGGGSKSCFRVSRNKDYHTACVPTTPHARTFCSSGEGGDAPAVTPRKRAAEDVSGVSAAKVAKKAGAGAKGAPSPPALPRASPVSSSSSSSGGGGSVELEASGGERGWSRERARVLCVVVAQACVAPTRNRARASGRGDGLDLDRDA